MRNLRFFVSLFLSFFVLGISSTPAYPAYYKGTHTILVNPAIPLHQQSRDAIYSLRKRKINDDKILGIFPENYVPAASIYGQINEKAGRVHDTQFFVNNPYLLAVISSGNKVNAFLPYCNMNSVEYSHGKITETYKGRPAEKWFFFAFDYYGDFKGIIRLWFVNAYDAGFKYAHVDSSKSLKLYYAYRGVHYQLGECYRLKGKYDLARLEFKREINLNPSYRDRCKIGLQKIEAELDPNKDHGDLLMTVKQEKVAGFIISGRDFIPGSSIDEIRQRLGNPVAEQIEARQNHHVQGQIDEIHTLDYNGLVIKIKRVNGASPRDLLFGLTITDRRIVLKRGLKIGTPRNQVINLFGQPREDENSLTYATETGSVTFFFSKDLLEKVQWQWNID